MKVLFFTNPEEDYLADGVFHGLRTLLGDDCIDYPKCEIMYKNCPPGIKKQVRGNGFSLYSGLLDDIPVNRFKIEEKIGTGYFDLIVFANIQRQFGLFTQYRHNLNSKNTIVLDGEDISSPYPARGFWWRKLYCWNLPKAHKEFLYFKREWMPNTYFTFLTSILHRVFKINFPQAKNLRKVAFSFPQEKIFTGTPIKVKVFPKHIVDTEVANNIDGSVSSYAFENEDEYYSDLQCSTFGVTTLRAGWDCLRHYEIAANQCLPCFKQLNLKPDTCAPHDLDESNCIIYSDYKDLQEQISKLSKSKYKDLLAGSSRWIANQTTVKRAEEVIGEFLAFKAAH